MTAAQSGGAASGPSIEQLTASKNASEGMKGAESKVTPVAELPMKGVFEAGQWFESQSFGNVFNAGNPLAQLQGVAAGTFSMTSGVLPGGKVWDDFANMLKEGIEEARGGSGAAISDVPSHDMGELSPTSTPSAPAQQEQLER